MTHKIAIITSRETYSNYGDDREVVIQSITEWTEVSDEEYELLVKAQNRLWTFHILEQPVDTTVFVTQSVADYIRLAKADEEKEAKEKKQREEAALARKIKKELKDKASKEKMLAKLAEELGVGISGIPKIQPLK